MLRTCLGGVLAVLVTSSFASAAVFGPGDAVPNVNGTVFTWSASAANSSFAEWNSFNEYPGGPPIGSLGGYGPGTTPAPQSEFAGSGGAPSLIFNSFGTIVSSGNAYGGTFAPAPDESVFITDATAIVRSGTDGGDFTRIVAQWDTLGTELDYSSILLSFSTAAPGSIAPSLAIETGRTALGGAFGGAGISYLALWDLSTSQDEFRFDFNAQSTNMSIDNFRVDSFVQSAPFVTPTAVPEPGSFVLLGAVGVAAFAHRRRNNARRRQAIS